VQTEKFARTIFGWWRVEAYRVPRKSAETAGCFIFGFLTVIALIQIRPVPYVFIFDDRQASRLVSTMLDATWVPRRLARTERLI
jgi:hypothetical protein